MFKVYQPSWLKIVCVSSAGKGVCEAWNPKFVCCKMSSAWCKSCVWLKGWRWQSMNQWLQMEPFLLAWEQKRVLQTSASAMEQHPPICGANSFISTSLASCVLGELGLLWLGLCRQDCHSHQAPLWKCPGFTSGCPHKGTPKASGGLKDVFI